MNTTLRTNINLLISTLRTASLNIADEAVKNVEKDAARKVANNDKNKDSEQ